MRAKQRCRDALRESGAYASEEQARNRSGDVRGSVDSDVSQQSAGAPSSRAPTEPPARARRRRCTARARCRLRAALLLPPHARRRRAGAERSKRLCRSGRGTRTGEPFLAAMAALQDAPHALGARRCCEYSVPRGPPTVAVPTILCAWNLEGTMGVTRGPAAGTRGSGVTGARQLPSTRPAGRAVGQGSLGAVAGAVVAGTCLAIAHGTPRRKSCVCSLVHASTKPLCTAPHGSQAPPRVGRL